MLTNYEEVTPFIKIIISIIIMQKFNLGLYEHYNYKSLFIREHKQSIKAKPRVHT